MNRATFLTLVLSCPSPVFGATHPRVIGPGGGSDLFFIVPHPRNPSILFVGGDIEGIFRSMDGGATWENTSTGLSSAEHGRNVYFIQDILVDTLTERVYLATGVGLFVSSDTGRNWDLLWSRPLDPSGEEYASVGVVALRPSTPPEIWIGLGDRYPTAVTPTSPHGLPMTLPPACFALQMEAQPGILSPFPWIRRACRALCSVALTRSSSVPPAGCFARRMGVPPGLPPGQGFPIPSATGWWG